MFLFECIIDSPSSNNSLQVNIFWGFYVISCIFFRKQDKFDKFGWKSIVDFLEIGQKSLFSIFCTCGSTPFSDDETFVMEKMTCLHFCWMLQANKVNVFYSELCQTGQDYLTQATTVLRVCLRQRVNTILWFLSSRFLREMNEIAKNIVSNPNMNPD